MEIIWTHIRATSLAIPIKPTSNSCKWIHASEVDWEAHETHTSGSMLSEFYWGAQETCTSGCMLSEVDWGAHDSSFLLYQERIDNDGEPKDLFTHGLWGRLSQRNFSTVHFSL